MSFIEIKRKNPFFRGIVFSVLCAFNVSLVFNPSRAYAAPEGSVLGLPAPGTMVSLTHSYVPVIAKGLRVHPENPVLFDFIIDTGNSGLDPHSAQLRAESEKLIKYFLASLTIPEDDLWVNLSPYEKNHIIPEQLGQTEMGRDMLAQDYILKQLTASLIYPEKDLGKEFWNRVYAKAQQLYGTTEIPVNTFNKVWIVADKAKIYVHDNTAFVVGSHLRVMLEQDYLSLSKHQHLGATQSANTIGSQMVREIVLPELEKEVNSGKNFANLRQIFNSMILAAWYKKNLKEALLNQVYSNKAKINGVNVKDKTIKERIYQEYLKAYKKGVFNYIKEDHVNGQPVARKYFSGGEELMRVFKSDGLQEVNENDPAVRHFAPDGAMLSVSAQAVLDHETPSLAELNTADKIARARTIESIQDLLLNNPSPFIQRTANDRIRALNKERNIADEAMATGSTSNLLGEIPQLGITSRQLANEIQKEISHPGSGNIPLIATISDQHGTIDKFDALLLDIFRSVPAGKNIPASLERLDPDKSLAEQGIRLQDFKGQLFIHNLGDFMDRGPYGVKVFYRSKELIDAGLSDFVVGNHDQWMFMNLIGFHLPYYDNFEFYGYKDSYDSKRGGSNVRFLLAQKHQTNPETRKPMWWAKKLAEFRKFHEDQQKTRWRSIDDQVNGPQGLFVRVLNGRSEDEKKKWYSSDAGRVWNKLRGFDPNVGEVATGVKAVGLVSIVWWEQLLREFESTYNNLYVEHNIKKDSEVQEAWKSAINLIKNQIIPNLKETLEEHINPSQGEPQWWWRIFEAINSQNYTSPEWWAQDWAYHKGWGPTVFKEINDTYHEGQDVVTVANYLDENSDVKGVSILKEIAKFYKDHYTLHIRDIMQTDLMHAFLPIDPKTGEFYFNYKSQQYQGKGGQGTLPYWEGLQRIAEDIRNAPNDETLIKNIYEAKTVVNAWYADNTTEAKAVYIAKAFRDIGVKKVADANGINRLITGHIPMHDYLKLTEDQRRIITGHLISTEDGRHTFADSDGGMGERFGGGGKYLIQDREGFRLRGFPSRKSQVIVDNPATIIFKKDSTTGVETEKLIYKNDNPVPSNLFLTSVLESIRKSQNNEAADEKLRKAAESSDTISETVQGDEAMVSIERLLPQQITDRFKLAYTDAVYFSVLIAKYLSDRIKPVLGKNGVASAMLDKEARQKLFGITDAKDLMNNPNYIQAAKAVHMRVLELKGGLGTSFLRLVTLKRLLGRDKIADKGTDSYFENVPVRGFDISGNQKQFNENISVAELKLLYYVYLAQQQEFSEVEVRELVNDESKEAVAKFWDTIYLADRVDDRIPANQKRTYRQIFSDPVKGIQGLRFNPDFIVQGVLPVVDAQTGAYLNDAPLRSPGGHAAFVSLTMDENARNQKDLTVPRITVFTNGDGVNNMLPPAVAGWMVKNNIPIAMITTTKQLLDLKGGLITLLSNKDLPADIKTKLEHFETLSMDEISDLQESLYPYLLELAQAKAEKQQDIFQNMGITLGEKSAQFFNTNVHAQNHNVLDPFLAELQHIIGPEKFYEIIGPDLITNPKEKKLDGKSVQVIQLEGASGSALLAMNRFILTTTDPRIIALKKKYGIERLVHFVNFDEQLRSEVFTPEKYTWDHYLYAFTDLFSVDPMKGRLVFTPVEGRTTLPGFDLDKYYEDLENDIAAFGRRLQVKGLDYLAIRGTVHLPDAVLRGGVFIKNRSGKEVDLTAKQDLFPSENGHLVLDNVYITIDEQENITAKPVTDILKTIHDFEKDSAMISDLDDGIVKAAEDAHLNLAKLLEEFTSFQPYGGNFADFVQLKTAEAHSKNIPQDQAMNSKDNDKKYVIVQDQNTGSRREIKYGDGLNASVYLTIPGPETKISLNGTRSGIRKLSGDKMSLSARDIRDLIDNAMTSAITTQELSTQNVQIKFLDEKTPSVLISSDFEGQVWVGNDELFDGRTQSLHRAKDQSAVFVSKTGNLISIEDRSSEGIYLEYSQKPISFADASMLSLVEERTIGKISRARTPQDIQDLIETNRTPSVEKAGTAQLKWLQDQKNRKENNDSAMRGGIDFNSKNLEMDVNGEKVNIQFDQKMLEDFKRGDFSGVRPVILNITPISSILHLLGLNPASQQLAKI